MSGNTPRGVVRSPASELPLAVGQNRLGTLVVVEVNGLGQARYRGQWNEMGKLGDPIPEDRLACVGWVVEAGS